MAMLKINNSPSHETKAWNRVLPSLRALAYSAQKPNPITNQSVKIVTIIVGVFIVFNPYLFEDAQNSYRLYITI